MRTTTRLAIGAIVAAGFAMACGGSSSNNSNPNPNPNPQPAGYYIAIHGMAFSPLNLDVPPGGTVTVVNQDGSTPHSVTSEAKAADFTPGGVAGVTFDTGLFTGSKSFTILANAPEGTVVPYFCMNHKAAMATPTGTITVKTGAPTGPAPATPGGTGGGGGGY